MLPLDRVRIAGMGEPMRLSGIRAAWHRSGKVTSG